MYILSKCSFLIGCVSCNKSCNYLHNILESTNLDNIDDSFENLIYVKGSLHSKWRLSIHMLPFSHLAGITYEVLNERLMQKRGKKVACLPRY
jgi:hypothetical protein